MKLFARWLRGAQGANANPVSSDPGLEMISRFGEEMGEYLWEVQRTYEPKPFHGRVHVFVSQYRPTGWLADPSLGWGRLATEGAEAVRFEGDHESLFDEPAAGLAAATIAAALASPRGPRPLESARSVRRPFTPTANPRQRTRS